MVVGSLVREHQSRVPIDRLFKVNIIEGHDSIPKHLPDVVSRVDVVGDGGPGTTKKVHYAKGLKYLGFTTYKFLEIDHENNEIKFATIDGKIIVERVKCFTGVIKLDPIISGGTLVKLIIDYETSDDHPLNLLEEEVLAHSIMSMIKGIEEHII